MRVELQFVSVTPIDKSLVLCAEAGTGTLHAQAVARLCKPEFEPSGMSGRYSRRSALAASIVNAWRLQHWS